MWNRNLWIIGMSKQARKVHHRIAECSSASHMNIISGQAKKHANVILKGLEAKGWTVVDNFLGIDIFMTMRVEAENLYEDGWFSISQSTRWDTSKNSSVTYDKHNVYSMQLDGGAQYFAAPHLHEYLVSVTKTLQPIIAEKFPAATLSDSLVSNKLAVCTGDGSSYDKHYDNSGLDDTRKVTVLYYMNNWRPEMGGCFRIHNSVPDVKINSELGIDLTSANTNDISDVVDIEPHGDRLLVFWSDRLVHSVLSSAAPNGKEDHRYALTLWFTSETPDAIVRNDAEIAQHFGNL